MSAYEIQTPGNYPGESIKHSEHGGNLKSIYKCTYFCHLWQSKTVFKPSLEFTFVWS